MKVVYTDEALNDLAAIADWLRVHYPSVAPAVERRIRRVVAHVARWPASARRASSRRDVRVVPLGRYPYKIFYRVTVDAVRDPPHPSCRAAALERQPVGRISAARIRRLDRLRSAGYPLAACPAAQRRRGRRRPQATAMTPDLLQKLIAWRHHLHAHPELSLKERATSAFVQERLTELGVPFAAGIGGHGVVATLSRGHARGNVGLRADMDALPITETTGLPYASRKAGVMHACGHDGHTVSLLGAAALLATDADWSGTVHFVFQPAEEGFRGSRAMIDAGLFDRFPMARIFGFHNWPGLQAGTVAVHDGVVMASGGRVTLTIDGHPGHAGMPHLTRDPVLAAGHLIVALQSIVSRHVDPTDTAVLSLCTIEGGTAPNQIAQRVVIRGTLRNHRDEVRAVIVDGIERICAGIATSFNVKVTPEITAGLGPVVNTPMEADLARLAAETARLPLRRDLAPSMAGEDFALYLQHRPGAFVWIGNGELRQGAELHGPGYDFNDAILPAASRWMAEVAKAALASNQAS